jgi:hypothetical protein
MRRFTPSFCASKPKEMIRIAPFIRRENMDFNASQISPYFRYMFRRNSKRELSLAILNKSCTKHYEI